MDDSNPILWRPQAERIAASALTRFARFAREVHGAPPAASDPETGWQALHGWSVRERAAFWSALWDFSGILGERGRATLIDGERMPGARWFDGARLNYAENLLAGPAADIVLITRDEAGGRRSFTRGELRQAVDSVAAAFAAAGIRQGMVVAGFLTNSAEALIAMLATAHLGAVWTSMSPEFGAASALERFGQTGAVLLVATGTYHYGGKTFDCGAKIDHIARGLRDLRRLVLVGDPPASGVAFAGSLRWQELLNGNAPVPPALRVAFDAPLFVLYSSGTTGKPKAIVHGVGGTLLQHRKEHMLHTDVQPGDRVFYYTTCGWMMWNWLVSALASGAALVLYDGSPAWPDEDVLWRMVEEEGINVFGTSPRFLASIEKSGHRPGAEHDLSALRTILSTGAPLAGSQFEYVYSAISTDVHLASISGGTDIVSCFCLGVPWLPVRRGEIQAAGLGMAVAVMNEAAQPVTGQRGELVCTAAFPSMPLGFLEDPHQTRYRSSYFARHPDIWYHGDFAVQTPSGGFIILGRSDTVLNPGGVRIGTAEIYRQVERIPAVLECLAIGQQVRDEERIVLFVRLAQGGQLDAQLMQQIRQTIRDNASPRHVPERIVAVQDLPRTMSGKLAEMAVRDIVHGRVVVNRDALANPAALELFRDLPALRD